MSVLISGTEVTEQYQAVCQNCERRHAATQESTNVRINLEELAYSAASSAEVAGSVSLL